MSTPRGLRDVNWVRGALQAAVALEHATMPPYTAAMYSLEVQNYPSYNTIRSVLMEEMLHMGAVCNMLAALGGSPAIRSLNPRYPANGLPGGVAPELRLPLAKLSARQLDNFMRVEAPTYLLERSQRSSTYPTVGAFYEAIMDAIRANAAAVRRAVASGGPANQVGGNLGYRSVVPDPRVDPVESCLEILTMVSHQGEGDSGGMATGVAFQGEASHYARFGELRYGRRCLAPAEPPAELTAGNVQEYFRGAEIPWPVVINTLALPSDGYARILDLDPAAPLVRKELAAFDTAYTAMMAALDHAWNGPQETSWPSLGEAVIQMNEMRVISCFNIIRHQVPPSAIAMLAQLYPGEHRLLSAHTDLDQPVFYGPRFVNLTAGGR
jgi:hypothetical protein